MMKQDVNVKSYLRGGKLVHGYTQERDHALHSLRGAMEIHGKFTPEQIDTAQIMAAHVYDMAAKNGSPLPEVVNQTVNNLDPTGKLKQVEGILRGEEPAPFFTGTKSGGKAVVENLQNAAKFLDDYAAKHPVFKKPFDELTKEEIVQGLYEHSKRELDAWAEICGTYKPFYGYDILERTNPKLQAYAQKEYGRPLTEGEVRLFHLVSGLGAAQATPNADTQLGFKVFDKFMKTGVLEAVSDKQKTVWGTEEDETGKPIKDSKGNANRFDTGILVYDENGDAILAKDGRTYNTSALARVESLIKKTGSVDAAMEWLGSIHPKDEIFEMFGRKKMDSSILHENLTRENGGYGIFGLGSLEKIGAYILNRWQIYGVITKDMWVARTMARLSGQGIMKGGHVTSEPWAPSLTKREGMYRKALDEAWTRLAREEGLTPADIQQHMWDMEQILYRKLGSGEPATYASDGLEMAIKKAGEKNARILSGITDPKKMDAPTPEEAKAGSSKPIYSEGLKGAKGTYSPVTRVIELIKGKADFSTVIHEVGHFFHQALLEDPRFAPVIEHFYGNMSNIEGAEHFAQHFEGYMRHGETPAKPLTHIFAAIRGWMQGIYEKWKYGKTPDEVRAIFDQVYNEPSDETKKLIRQFNKKYGDQPVNLTEIELSQAGQITKVKSYLRGGKLVHGYQQKRERGEGFIKGNRVSWEAVPSTHRGFLPEVHQMDYDQKEALTRAVIRAFTDPNTGEDRLAKALGLPTPRLELSPGWWEGVSNPSVQATFAPTADPEAIRTYAAVIGKALDQDGVGMHRVVSGRRAKSVDDVNLTVIPVEPTTEHIAKLSDTFNKLFPESGDGLAIISDANGVRVLNVTAFSEKPLSNAEFVKAVETGVEASGLNQVADGPPIGYHAEGDFIGGDEYDETIKQATTSDGGGARGGSETGLGSLVSLIQTAARNFVEHRGSRGNGNYALNMSEVRVKSHMRGGHRVKGYTQDRQTVSDWHQGSHPLTKKADGTPRAFYHGTPSPGFSHFEKMGDRGQQHGAGFYLTSNPEDANNYTHGANKSSPHGASEGGIYPLHVKLENPIILKKDGDRVEWPELTRKQVTQIINSAPDIKDPDGPISNWGDVRTEGWGKVMSDAVNAYTGGEPWAICNDFFPGNDQAFLEAYSKATGFDGVLVPLIKQSSDEPDHYHAVAWFSNQVKSSIGGTGREINPQSKEFNMSEAVEQIATSAKVAAIQALIRGDILLTENDGYMGVWANGPIGRFFINLAVADRAYHKVSHNENDHALVWAQKKGHRPVQLQIDMKSGQIMNADKVLQSLLGLSGPMQIKALEELEEEYKGIQEDPGDEQPEEEEEPTDLEDAVIPTVIELANGYRTLEVGVRSGRIYNWHQVERDVLESIIELDDKGGAPPKATGADEHWITIKPHGPDSPDYRHVLIRSLPDGSAKIVWSGGGSLNHLRLHKVGTKEQIEATQKSQPRTLSPEERKAQSEERHQRKEALNKSRMTFAEAMVKSLGLEGKVAPEEIANAVENRQVERVADEHQEPKGESSEALSTEEKPKPEDEPKEKSLDQPDTMPEAVAKRMTQAVLGQDLGFLDEQTAPEIRAAWDEIKQDPEKRKEINTLIQGYRKEQNKIRREMKGSGAVRILGTIGYYVDDPASVEHELVNDAKQKFEKDVRSEFIRRSESLGAAGKYFGEGYVDAMSHALAEYGGSAQILSADVAHTFSPQVIAEVIATQIRELGPKARQYALDKLESDFVSKEFPTVQEAMARSQEMRDERIKVDHDKMAGNILASTASRALADLTINEKKHLARAAGSLEGMAQVLDALRQDKPRPIIISAGHNSEDLLNNFERVGMVEGKDFDILDRGIRINPESVMKFMKTLTVLRDSSKNRIEIKDHSKNTTDFEVPGVNPNWRGGKLTLSNEQQAAIRMFEADDPVTNHKLLGNLSVGLGKTITFGAAHARLMQRLKAQGKPSHGLYILPANLMTEAYRELHEAFPNMDIAMAEADRLSAKKRVELYHQKHDLTIISSDTVRSDAKALADLCNSTDGSAPAAIYGDEVHSLFSPNGSANAEDQSARSKALQQLQAPNMLVMTGTPFRRSLGEVWKVVNWLHPGKATVDGKLRRSPLGSISSFVKTFGSIGQGTSAYMNTQEDQLREVLDPYTITEKATPKTTHRQHVKVIKPSTEQFNAIRDIDSKYLEARKAGTATTRDITGNTAYGRRMERINQVMGAGTPESNPLLAETKSLIDKYHKEDRVGIVHCINLRTVQAVKDMYPPGEVLTITGDRTPDSKLRKERIKQCLNRGLPMEGIAVSVGGRPGIVQTVKREFNSKDPEGPFNIGTPVSAKVKFEDGTTEEHEVGDIKSEVKALAGSSVTSTGLNLQGTSYNIHLQAPDSAATKEQREARNYRTGQLHDVDSHYLVPDLPSGRKKAREIGVQKEVLKGIDDPRYAHVKDPTYLRMIAHKADAEEMATT